MYDLLVSVDQTKEVKAAPAKDAEAPAKPKPAAKAGAKPLPQLIQEEVIPSLQKILEAQDDLSEIELSFEENTVCIMCTKYAFLLLLVFTEYLRMNR